MCVLFFNQIYVQDCRLLAMVQYEDGVIEIVLGRWENGGRQVGEEGHEYAS